MSVGSIPWTAIIRYTEWHHLDRDIADAFVDIMREMDQAYVDYQEAEMERNKPKKPKK